ncbi:dehydrogenase/reductase SDR family member 13 isoform X2 [Ambystoma mexicanum]|uniref:dehydrogenase/reductase SDR family member 13 isoform X2 n=1 Tax=Ambystoma mexicanum TaxID=8296 RepID=UPI0037E83FE7
MENLLLGSGLVLGAYVLIYYNLIKGSRCRSSRSLKGKTVIITGGNTGIGKTTALDLARRGARIILACRSKERGESAVYDIRRESGNQQVLFLKLDLASLASVRQFADAFLKSEPQLDILINNAGVSSDGATEEGFNLMFGVNHLGHFLLTHLLLERLKRCTPSRIVILASNAYRNGKIDFGALNMPTGGWKQNFQAYCDSKLANILYARELATRLQGTNVTCYAVHPGVVRTELFRYMKLWMKVLVFPIAWLFFRDCTDGAQTSIHCAVQEGIEPFSGRFFANCRVKEVRSHARDDAVAKKLWEVSESMVGLAG